MLSNANALLESFLSEVELQGEVGNFPENLTVDLRNLEEGSQVLVKDIAIPNEMILETNIDLSVAKISSNINKLEENTEQ